MQHKADATWVFLGWEGVEARRKGVELNAFKLEDHGIKYGYSPLLVSLPETLRCAVDWKEQVSRVMNGSAIDLKLCFERIDLGSWPSIFCPNLISPGKICAVW